MTRSELLSKFPNASKAFIEANARETAIDPDVIRLVQTNQRKSDSLQTLDRRLSPRARRKRSVALVCTFIVLLQRRADQDNFTAGNIKNLRDAVSKSIGLDDGDPRIEWRYECQQTSGTEGVIVHMEAL